MLVLTRKNGEKIVVGNVTIEVVDIRCNRVRLGVTAPETTRILRGELKGQSDGTEESTVEGK